MLNFKFRKVVERDI